jgi:membrane protein YdbS with pleckstrin-like domain
MGVSPKKISKKQASNKRTFLVLDWSIVVIWIVIAYATASLALDTGSWWHYSATLIALYFIVRSLCIALTRRHGSR